MLVHVPSDVSEACSQMLVSLILQVTHIQQNTKIPVLGHADGICHVYVDRDADIQKACAIVVDSKVCPASRSQGVLEHGRPVAETTRLLRLHSRVHSGV